MTGWPTILLRILPHVAIALAIVGAVWWIDHQGYARARRDAEGERLVNALMLTRAARESDARILDRLTAIGADLGRARAAIAATRTAIQPTILKELTRETRYSDPAAGLSDSLRAAVDRARAAIACTATADGGIVCALPPASVPGGQ